MIFALQGAAKIETIQADWSVSSEVDTGAREANASEHEWASGESRFYEAIEN
jgi:hypothetical protein